MKISGILFLLALVILACNRKSTMVSSDNTVGNLFYGSKGYMIKNVNEWQTFFGKESVAGEKGSGLGGHK